jgi:acyl dehydratase
MKAAMSTTVHIDQLGSLAGTHLGYSPWHLVDQDQINRFADATGDHQWIHVDLEQAKQGPFGTTIAHGFLTVSLIPYLLPMIWDVEGISMGINYGTNKIRFPAPVPAGSEVRLGAALASLEDVSGGVQALLDLDISVRDADKPSCVAQAVFRYYR